MAHKSMQVELPSCWEAQLQPALTSGGFRQLSAFVDRERERCDVYPDDTEVFRALQLTPFDAVNVVILGQDPYPGTGQAHGLAFSVRPDVALPRSLANIFVELTDDLRAAPPPNGNLEPWAEQGVLLLNTVLTVRAGEPNSHRGRGWEQLTDSVIRQLSASTRRRVFVLWGRPAQTKARLIDARRHRVLTAPHPSPLSARRGFFGSRPFSTINRQLIDWGRAPIDWASPGPVTGHSSPG